MQGARSHLRKDRRLATALLTAAIACGGGQRTVPLPEPASCDAVADHLVVLAEHDNGGLAGADLAAGIRDEALRQCRDTPWSAERRDCLAAATDQEATLACPGR